MSSSMSFSSWSNLPLDLLLSIKKKLQLYKRFDLNSFRSVCLHWCSAMPVPSSFPGYEVSFNKNDKVIQFINDNKTINTDGGRSIHLSLSSSSPISFFCSSNGWLVFKTCNNWEILHVIDPVSNEKHIFPPLSPPNILYRYNKFKSTLPKPSWFHFSKVIVSSSIDDSVVVAGIIHITGQTQLDGMHRRFVICKYGDGQRWNLFIEESKRIVDIALAGDGRFYAIAENWEFYMLDERPPVVRLKKFKLWLPKQILEPDPESDPIDERLSISCSAMEKSGESDLKIYGSCERFRFKGSWIALKLEVAKLCGASSNVDVACEANWYHLDPRPYYGIQHFTPSLRGRSTRS